MESVESAINECTTYLVEAGIFGYFVSLAVENFPNENEGRRFFMFGLFGGLFETFGLTLGKVPLTIGLFGLLLSFFNLIGWVG